MQQASDAQALALQMWRVMGCDRAALRVSFRQGRFRAVLLATAALTLLGCSGKAKPFAAHSTESAPAPPASASPTPPPTQSEQQSPKAAAPTATTPNDETSTEAAAAVLRAYYEAIAARDYEGAYRLWWNAGRASGQTLEQFRHGFAETASVEATIDPPGRIEGAAGSRYVDMPVHVRARTRHGEPQCFTGSYTLRRSEVEGAGEEQRHWRIYSASLSKCPERAM